MSKLTVLLVSFSVFSSMLSTPIVAVFVTVVPRDPLTETVMLHVSSALASMTPTFQVKTPSTEDPPRSRSRRR